MSDISLIYQKKKYSFNQFLSTDVECSHPSDNGSYLATVITDNDDLIDLIMKLDGESVNIYSIGNSDHFFGIINIQNREKKSNTLTKFVINISRIR